MSNIIPESLIELEAIEVIRELLDAPDLWLDELEPATRRAIRKAKRLLHSVEHYELIRTNAELGHF